VAFSIGEIVAGTLIVHIEKALSKYSGAYTLMAQEFAKLYADGEYINREDDAGDLGLRISKTQYRPYALLHKYEVTVNRSFNSLFKLPTLTTERLTLSALKSEDCETYDKLNLDNALNIYWGYDYREDLRQELYNGYFLDVAKKDFKEKTVLCFGIRLNGELIGETVLQNFDFHSQAEVGCRVFSDFAGRGYGREALKATLSWAIKYLHLDKVVAKCYIQNTASFIMLVKSGMREVDKDDKFIYFEL
ncbi:MAG: GNAT family N-acetyltransferase, partial [Clostridia bacterium]